MIIASGSNFWDIANLGQYDQYFQEGDAYQLRLTYSNPISAGVAQSVSAFLSGQVTEPYNVYQTNNEVFILANKGNPFYWALIVAVPALLLILAFFVAWQLSRIPSKTVEVVGEGLEMVKVAAVVLGVYWLAKQFEKPGRRSSYG